MLMITDSLIYISCEDEYYWRKIMDVTMQTPGDTHPPARPLTRQYPRSPLELQGKNYSTLHQTFISSHFE